MRSEFPVKPGIKGEAARNNGGQPGMETVEVLAITRLDYRYILNTSKKNIIVYSDNFFVINQQAV
jgi:hypothetical protein